MFGCSGSSMKEVPSTQRERIWEFPISWSTREREREEPNRFKVRTACNPGPAGMEEDDEDEAGKKKKEKKKRSTVQEKTCAFVSVTIAKNMCATLLSFSAPLSPSFFLFRGAVTSSLQSEQNTPAEKVHPSREN